MLVVPSTAGAVRSEFFGIVQGQFEAEGQLDNQDLQAMQNARVHTDRFEIGWRMVEPTRNTFHWAAYDGFIGALASHGIRAVPFVWGSPSWVESGPGHPPIDTPAHEQEWRDFLKAAVARYGPGGTYWTNQYRQDFGAGATPLPVQSWQIWNEPNLRKFFDPTGSDAQLAQKYGRLLKISHDAITNKDPGAQIILAGNPGYPPSGGPKAWEFLSSLYDVPGIKGYFDAVALHPYASDLLHVQIEIQNVRNVMQNRGDQATPLWITEIGWGSDPPDRYGINQGIQGQKERLSGAYRMILSHRNAWNVQRLYWFLWRDPSPSSAFAHRCSFCGSAGLLHYNRTQKPAFQIFKSFTADTDPPIATIMSGPQDGGVTNNPTPTFSIKSNQIGSTFECHVGPAPFAPCGPTYKLAHQSDGAHTFFTRATDAAGNVSSIKSRSFTVDTVPPTVTISSGPANGSATSSRSASFSFSTSDSSADLKCQVDGGAFQDCSSPVNLSGLGDGSHTFKARATDPAGNNGVASSTWTVDTVAPTVAITAGPDEGSTSGNPRPTFDFDASESGATFQCQIDGGGFHDCGSPFTVGSRLADGQHTLDVEATDRAGNTGPSIRRTWTVEAALNIRITAGLAPGAITNDPTPGFKFFSADQQATFRCRWDGPGHSFHACASPYSPTTRLPDGQHMFSVKAIDGPDQSEVASRSFRVDTVAPKAHISSGPADGSSSSDPSPSFSFASNEPGSHYQCRLGAATYARCDSPKALGPLSEGGHLFAVRAIDRAGNKGAPAEVRFRVDTLAPRLRIKGTGEIRTTRTRASALFVLKASEPVGRACRLGSRAFKPCSRRYRTPRLPKGPHTLSVKATDRAGNVTTRKRHFRIVEAKRKAGSRRAG